MLVAVDRRKNLNKFVIQRPQDRLLNLCINIEFSYKASRYRLYYIYFVSFVDGRSGLTRGLISKMFAAQTATRFDMRKLHAVYNLFLNC
jgi:hypothetical protein